MMQPELAPARLTSRLADHPLIARLAPYRNFILFVIMGLVNTVITYAVYLAALRLVDYQNAFSLSYVVGIFVAYWLNTHFVFRQPATLKRALQYPLVYLVQWLLGLVLIVFLVDTLALPESLAPLVVTALTLPVTFIMSKTIINGRLEAWVARRLPHR